MNNTKVEKIKETKFIETRDMNEVNISKVKNYDWSFIYSFENVDFAYGCFSNIFKKMYDECCPVQTKQRSVKFRKEWMTPCWLRLWGWLVCIVNYIPVPQYSSHLIRKITPPPPTHTHLHYVLIRQCGLVETACTWDGTGC